MKRFFFTVLAALLALSASAQQATKSRLTQHVYYLASDELRGRAAGSADALKAAAYIKEQYQQIGLKPFFEEWEQPFQKNDEDYTNIVGIIEGSDPVYKNEYIVIGAHYDHLGIKNGEIYNGADDNASGSAALIEIARTLISRGDNLRRSVIIAAFDGEELGLYGSNQLAKRLSATDVNVVLMMSIDMVGWYGKSGKLILEGTGTFKDGDKLLEDIAEKDGIIIKTKPFETSILTATDTEGFAKAGIPTLDATTGLKSPYHKPEDDADLIDYDGMVLVTEYISDVISAIASDINFKSSGKVATKHQSAGTPKTPYALDLALVGQIGSSNINYKNSAITGQTGNAYTLGLSASLKLKSLHINTGALWERTIAPFPKMDDVFNGKVDFKMDAVTVPLTIDIIHTDDGIMGFYAALGAFYSHTLGEARVPGTDYYATKNQAGIAYSFIWRIARISLGFNGFYQSWNPLFDQSRIPTGGVAAPDGRLNRAYLIMTYRF